MLKKIILTLALIGIFAGAGFYYRHHGEAVKASSLEPAAKEEGKPAPAVTVEATEVEQGAVESKIEAVGTLISNESVILSPELAGRIAEIMFQEGQEVIKGSPLFRLDDQIYKAELSEAEASLVLSRANNTRAKELFKDNVGTGRAKDEAQSNLNADLARVDLYKARLDKTVIRAPFDGLIGLRQVSVGDYVNPGQALVNIESIDPLKVDFRISEIYLSKLKQGQKIDVMIDAFPGQTFSGEIYAIDPRIDSEGRTVVMRARLPNQEKMLRPGLFARVNVLVGRNESALLIPEQALMPEGKDQYVYKVVDSKAVRTKVMTGLRRSGTVEITTGLKPGDVIITAGHLKVRPDSLVSVVSAEEQSQ